MQHAQSSRPQVGERAGHRAQLAVAVAGEADGDGVDREVPAQQVILGTARSDLGQGSRSRVGLRAPRCDVDAASLPGEERRFEARVGAQLDARMRVGAPVARQRRGELARELLGSALHHHVELSRRAGEQQIARRAADQLGVFARGDEAQQLAASGKIA